VLLALMQRLAGDMADAKVTVEQARNTLKLLCRKQPENAHLVRFLSSANATFGEKQLAVKDADRAIMLLPRAKDQLAGPGLEETLALT
jgi:hypothetical protein